MSARKEVFEIISQEQNLLTSKLNNLILEKNNEESYKKILSNIELAMNIIMFALNDEQCEAILNVHKAHVKLYKATGEKRKFCSIINGVIDMFDDTINVSDDEIKQMADFITNSEGYIFASELNEKINKVEK